MPAFACLTIVLNLQVKQYFDEHYRQSRMLFSKNAFFSLLLLLLFTPIILPNIIWLLKAKKPPVRVKV